MAVKIGDVDIVASTLNNEYRLGVLEKTLERLIAKNPSLRITNSDLVEARREALSDLQEKYPNMNIREGG
jgi:anti-sigma-K factor RskA